MNIALTCGISTCCYQTYDRNKSLKAFPCIEAGCLNKGSAQ